jgi:hypothetical protein
MQKALAMLLCSMVVVAASCRILAQPDLEPPPYKIIKLTQRQAYPVLPSLIFERTIGIEFNGALIGAGVILESGRVLTAAHVVVARDGKYMVRLKDTDGVMLVSDFKVIKTNKELDLAQLSCFTGQFDKLKLGGDIPLGHPMVMSGSPAGLKVGLLSGLGFLTRKEKNIWFASQTIYFGFSGGGVWDVNSGVLLGIVQSSCFDRDKIPIPGTAQFIPAKTIEEFLK